MVYRHWTGKDQDFLRRHYGPLSPEPWEIKAIAAQMGRSYNAVVYRLKGGS